MTVGAPARKDVRRRGGAARRSGLVACEVGPREGLDGGAALRRQAQRGTAAVDAVGDTAAGVSVYHELDPTFYSVTSTTFIGKVYELFGLKNIADGAQPGNDYPQLNAEFIVKANPGLIVLADSKCCGATSASVSGRPGWNVIDAVKNSKVVAVDDDIASRWGPRVVDFVMAISKALSGK